MSDIELVIKIPEDTFFDLKRKQNRTEVDNAVLNGTPLPKKTAGWRDADDPPENDREILVCFSNYSGMMVANFKIVEAGSGIYYLGDDLISRLLTVEKWHELPRR